MATTDGGASAPDGFDVAERDVRGVRVLSARGSLDLTSAVHLCRRVDAARGEGCRRLLVDLTRVGSCDSSGLRLLIGAAYEVAASAGRLAVVPPRERGPAHTFAVTGAPELLTLRPSVSEGVAALAR